MDMPRQQLASPGPALISALTAEGEIEDGRACGCSGAGGGVTECQKRGHRGAGGGGGGVEAPSGIFDER